MARDIERDYHAPIWRVPGGRVRHRVRVPVPGAWTTRTYCDQSIYCRDRAFEAEAVPVDSKWPACPRCEAKAGSAG